MFLLEEVYTVENWPPFTYKANYQKLVDDTLVEYKGRQNFHSYIKNYNPTEDYLNWGANKKYIESQSILFDPAGIPKVKYGNDYYYNPIMVSQFALTLHGRYKRGEVTVSQFSKAVDLLTELQESNGSLPFPFTFHYYRKVFKPGWISGMAQGQALSAYARAFEVTNNKKYINKGNKCLGFLLKPIEEGGTLTSLKDIDESLTNYLIFEKYPVEPSSYTLNGFLFTLLGLYDWWKVTLSVNKKHALLAEKYFYEGIKTTKKILRYYDIGGYSTYDLAHIVYKMDPKIYATYHPIHIYLLHALYTVTGDKILRDFANLWASYIRN